VKQQESEGKKNELITLECIKLNHEEHEEKLKNNVLEE
jgi:hypothetical protein